MKSIKSLFFCAVFFVFLACSSILIGDKHTANAASSTGQALQFVPGNIHISKVSDLDFGSALAGEASKRVAPGNTENPENGSFLVLGIPGNTFNVTLPPGSVFLNHPSSGDQIEVRRFRSRPNGSGRIRNNGERMLFIGATRRRIGANVESGLYTGTFTVTVVY